MKLLLTGAGGQLARALVDVFHDHEVDARDHAGLDIASPDAVARALDEARPDVLVNAAAWTDVDGAESDPEGAARVNTTGPRLLGEACAAREVPLLHVSTDYVFDGEARRPYFESDPPNPKSVYGRTKLEGEMALAAAQPRHWIVRTAWLYHVVGRNFALTMRRVAAQGSARVVDDQIGSPTFAPHLATAIRELLTDRRYEYGIRHLAGRGHTSWCGLARALFDALECEVAVEPIATEDWPRPAPRPHWSVLGTEREPLLRLPPWEEGVREFARRLREEDA